MTSYEHKVKNIYLGGGTYHIPSQQEFADLKSIMDGLSLTTYTDYKAKLHMPLAGYRNFKAVLNEKGTLAAYFSSSPNSSDSDRAYSLKFSSTTSVEVISTTIRATAETVRLFKDEYVEPDNTWTVVAGSLGSAGIFHNTTLGLISVTNGTDKNITMKDKNEGATVVYNNGDTLSESNCGKYYQRGNYYGFPFTGNISNTSSTQVSTAGYGGSNPYSSSTYITGSENWSNPSNDNLWADSSDEYFV